MKPTSPATRSPTARQRWLELDGLAQHYLALPAGDSPEREQLRQRILRLLAAGWVKFTSDGEAQRDEDVLSRTFREQAVHLARRYGSGRLVQAYGGLENLSDEAKAEFLARRTSRAGQKHQTLLTGLLSQWDPDKGDLRVFMQRAVRNFLLDLYDKCYGRGDWLNGAPGATPRGFLTDDTAPAGEDADPDDWLDAVSRTSGAADTADAEAAAHTEELFACLDEARDALSAAQRAVYDSEIQRHNEQLTDVQQARLLGLGSRNTLYKRRLALNGALRKLLAAAGHADGPI